MLLNNCTLLFDILLLPNLREHSIVNLETTLKKNYLNLIKLFHSDKTKTNDNITKHIIKANQILRDKFWRDRYVENGRSGLQPASVNGETISTGLSDEDWSDLPKAIEEIKQRTQPKTNNQQPRTEQNNDKENKDNEDEYELQLHKLLAKKYKQTKRLNRTINQITRLKQTYNKSNSEDDNKMNMDSDDETKDNREQQSNYPYKDNRKAVKILEHTQKKRKNKDWELKFRFIWKFGNNEIAKLERLEDSLHHRKLLVEYLKKLSVKKPNSFFPLVRRWPELASLIADNE